MEIYKKISSPASEKFKKLLKSQLSNEKIEDQRRFLISQKIDVLKSINSN